MSTGSEHSVDIALFQALISPIWRSHWPSICEQLLTLAQRRRQIGLFNSLEFDERHMLPWLCPGPIAP